MFRDVAFQRGLVELARHGILMQVVTGDAACAGMGAEGGGRKDVLPRPLAGMALRACFWVAGETLRSKTR